MITLVNNLPESISSDNYELTKDGVISTTRSWVTDYSDQGSLPHLISFNEVCLGQVVDNAGQRSPRLFSDLNHETNENLLTIRGQIADSAGQRSLLLGPGSNPNVHVAEEFADQEEYENPGDIGRRHLQSYHPQVARPNNKEGYKTICGKQLGYYNEQIVDESRRKDPRIRKRYLHDGIR